MMSFHVVADTLVLDPDMGAGSSSTSGAHGRQPVTASNRSESLRRCLDRLSRIS